MNAKLIVPMFAALLAACSSGAPQTSARADSSASAPPPAMGGDQVCNNEPIANLAGQAWSDRAASDAQQRSGASTLRVMKPGEVMTLEYNPRRLTVILDESNRVSSARCG
ncbi:hypothetical protein FOZ76_22355 [Verticiella sediminum]|uniref:Peptidase inhibitor I78 family protein n=1 Tax=Verticiella sediminum TaxID=1247510 RepID=A0A556ACF3_9BURK|nr:I78 family peptidase inhibitor [Verticiella sediminum]TSH90553.1 hypothetical protein FOZ76_22355 [Verticiella sediminum]